MNQWLQVLDPLNIHQATRVPGRNSLLRVTVRVWGVGIWMLRPSEHTSGHVQFTMQNFVGGIRALKESA